MSSTRPRLVKTEMLVIDGAEESLVQVFRLPPLGAADSAEVRVAHPQVLLQREPLQVARLLVLHSLTLIANGLRLVKYLRAR